MASDSILPPNDWAPRTIATLAFGGISLGVVGVIFGGYAISEAGKLGGRALTAIDSKYPFGTT